MYPHGRLTVSSWEEDCILVGGGLYPRGRRTVASWEEEFILIGG